MAADPRMDQYFARLSEIIDKHGWAVQAVMPTVEDPDKFPFAYTVGLWTSECHLDFLIMGLPPQTAQTILNVLGARVKDGETFDHGVTYSDVLQPTGDRLLPVKMIEVPPVWTDYFGMALRYYRSRHARGYGFLQVVWPDAEGLLPWHEDFDDVLRDRQPVLGVL